MNTGIAAVTLLRHDRNRREEPPIVLPSPLPPAPETFPGWNGEPLRWRHWACTGPPRAGLVLVHGIGGHSGQFAALAHELGRQGCELHAFDLPGHGASPGPRGWVPGWESFRRSLLFFLEHVAARTGSLPLFLLGHSMGATICLDLMLREPLPIQGLILSNPAIDARGVELWRRWLARLLNRVWPTFSVSTGIPLEAASRDPCVLAEYGSDPLRHNRCTVRLGSAFMEAAAAIRRSAGRLRTPLLLLLSGADRVTPPGSALRLFETIGSPDKTLKIYPQSYHELFADLDREQVLRDLVEWIRRHGG